MTTLKMQINKKVEESTSQVLLVDDDSEMSAMVGDYLRTRGFVVEWAGDGPLGLERAREGGWSIMILDVMLPSMDGFEVLRTLRSDSDAASRVPIVMLTAHGDETDRIVGLELGADDYLPKPFNPRELLARIHALLRRVETERVNATKEITSGALATSTLDSNTVSVLEIGGVELNTRARTVCCDGLIVELTVTEFDLLSYLMREAGRVVGREELSHEVLGRKLLSLDRSLDMHVLKIRRKLGPNSDGSERLQTVRGVGYLFALPRV